MDNNTSKIFSIVYLWFSLFRFQFITNAMIKETQIYPPPQTSF